MSARAKELAERFHSLYTDVLNLVEGLDEDQWRQAASAEGWSIAVVARHLAAGHFGMRDMLSAMAAGKSVPDLTMAQIDAANAEHAKEHADCSQAEVLDILRSNGPAMTHFLADLDDAALDRTIHLSAAGGRVSTQQLVEFVCLQSAGEHLASLKASLDD